MAAGENLSTPKQNWQKDLREAMKRIKYASYQTRKVLTEDDDYERLIDELDHAIGHIFTVLNATSDATDEHK